MMKAASRRYAKLLKVQNLVKMRDEMELQASRRDLAGLKEEDLYLLSLMQRSSNMDFIDPSLITRRFERNRHKESVLQARITDNISTLLQASRRCGILQEKKKEIQDGEERRELVDMLEEYIAMRCFRDHA